MTLHLVFMFGEGMMIAVTTAVKKHHISIHRGRHLNTQSKWQLSNSKNIPSVLTLRRQITLNVPPALPSQPNIP
jgi:hypothetical protein